MSEVKSEMMTQEKRLKMLREETGRYNIFSARMLVRHADDGKKYLYDLLAIKKETSSPL